MAAGRNLPTLAISDCFVLVICDQFSYWALRIVTKFPYWALRAHEGISLTGPQACPVLRRCLQTAEFLHRQTMLSPQTVLFQSARLIWLQGRV